MIARLFTPLALLMPLTFSAQAFEQTDLEGVWSSVIRNNDRGSLELNLRIVEEFGIFEFKSRRWGQVGAASCAYAFSLDGGKVDQIVINPAASFGDTCPQDFPFTAQRISNDELTFTIDESIRDIMGGVGEAQLFGVLRPLRDDERRADIPNFDILGIAPAMQRSDIEGRLAKLGFEKVTSRVTEYQGGFESVSEHWSRTPNGEGDDMDHISLSYTAVTMGESGAEKLAALSRENAPLEPLSLAVFENAIIEKYGPAPSYGDRQFFRDGRPVSREGNERCRAEIHQGIRFSHATYSRFSTSGGRGTKEYAVNCAAEIAVGVTGDTNTGAVKSYRIKLFDIDMIWEDFWNRWSAVEGAEIANQFEALSALSTDKPEL